MNDTPAASLEEHQQREAARALGRALWQVDIAASGTEHVAEARRADWALRREEFVRSAKRILRRLQDDGFALVKDE